MDMKTQNIYAAVILLNFIIDQTLMGIIQLNYETLGEQNVFKIWWIFHLWEIIEVHVIANIVIIKHILQMEEYNGYVGKQFPGQEKPRPLTVEPERAAVTETKPEREAIIQTVHERAAIIRTESERAAITEIEQLCLGEEAIAQSSAMMNTAKQLCLRGSFTATEFIQVEIH